MQCIAGAQATSTPSGKCSSEILDFANLLPQPAQPCRTVICPDVGQSLRRVPSQARNQEPHPHRVSSRAQMAVDKRGKAATGSDNGSHRPVLESCHKQPTAVRDHAVIMPGPPLALSPVRKPRLQCRDLRSQAGDLVRTRLNQAVCVSLQGTLTS